MPLVKAVCSNCGASLEIDNSKEVAICPFCNTSYIVEKAINNYNVQNNYNISNGINVEQKLKNAETFLQLGNKNKALEIYDELTDICTDDYRIWEGLFNCTGEVEYYKNMVKLNPECIKKHKDIIDDIFKRCSNELIKQKERCEIQIKTLQQDINDANISLKAYRILGIVGVCLLVLSVILLCIGIISPSFIATSIISLWVVLARLAKIDIDSVNKSTIDEGKLKIDSLNRQIKEYGEMLEKLLNGDIETLCRVQINCINNYYL